MAERPSPSYFIASIASQLVGKDGAGANDAVAEPEVEKHPTQLYAGWGVKSAQGRSKYMEDAFHVETMGSPASLLCGTGTAAVSSGEVDDNSICIPGFPQDLALFSVFDGHGGTEVAQHCSDRLHQHFITQLTATAATLQQDPMAILAPAASSSGAVTEATTPGSCSTAVARTVSHALRASFLVTDEELAGTETGEYIGCTAVVAIVSDQYIWVAHCGDSRAVIHRKGGAVDLTSDHKPTRADEAERIRAAGGRIVHNSGTNRVMGMLAMTRAIGDHYLRPYVIADPEVTCLERQAEDETMIIATDGLWDVFSSAEATALASRCINRSRERGMSKHAACRVAANVLAKAAVERGSRDNITVICIDISLSAEGNIVAGAEADLQSTPSDPEAEHLPGALAAGQPKAVDKGAEDATVSSQPEDPTAAVRAPSPPRRSTSSVGKYLLLKSQSQVASRMSVEARMSSSESDLLGLSTQLRSAVSAMPGDSSSCTTPGKLTESLAACTQAAAGLTLASTAEQSEEGQQSCATKSDPGDASLKSDTSSGLDSAASVAASASTASTEGGAQEAGRVCSGVAGQKGDALA